MVGSSSCSFFAEIQLSSSRVLQSTGICVCGPARPSWALLISLLGLGFNPTR